jgi:hypothetical protein
VVAPQDLSFDLKLAQARIMLGEADWAEALLQGVRRRLFPEEVRHGGCSHRDTAFLRQGALALQMILELLYN